VVASTYNNQPPQSLIPSLLALKSASAWYPPGLNRALDISESTRLGLRIGSMQGSGRA
jgi:hypothetical protein